MTGAVNLPPFFSLICLPSVGSTNDEAKRLADDGAAEGTLVWGLEQTAGRGRRGRGWHSPPGNLYMSAVLRPGRPAAQSALIGFVAVKCRSRSTGSPRRPRTVISSARLT